MATRTHSSIPEYPLVRKGPLCEPTVSTPQFHLPSPPTPTLPIITNKHHLPQCLLVRSQYWQVIPDLDLTGFVNDNSLDLDDLRESTTQDPGCRQHADSAKDDARSIQLALVAVSFRPELSGLDHVGTDELVEMLVPWAIQLGSLNGNLVSEGLTNRNGTPLRPEV